MRNLAGVEWCDEQIRSELVAAGIDQETVEQTRLEVPYTVIGKLCGWTFTRAWYYWVARSKPGHGIPEKDAMKLNATWYETVRVVGFAGGTDVSDWLSKSGTIDCYHIDTQQGLNVFADLISAHSHHAVGARQEGSDVGS